MAIPDTSIEKTPAMNPSKNSSAVTYSAVVSTVNADRSSLLSEVVSAAIHGLRLTVSLPCHSATAKNLARTGECVINLPDAETATAIEHLTQAVTSTAGNVDTDFSRAIIGGDFAPAHMTLLPSEIVSAWRALECPVQIESRIENAVHSAAHGRVIPFDRFQTFALEVLRVHLDPAVVDRDIRWWPLMRCLREAYQTSPATGSSSS